MSTKTASTTQSRHFVPSVAKAASRSGGNSAGLLASAGFVALLCAFSTTWAQVAPPLGTAQQFAVLGNSAVTGATGSGVLVNGDVGSSPTATISNFPPSSTAAPFIVHFTNDGVVQQARLDANAAYNALASQGSGTVLPDNLATVGALTPGIYSFATGTPNLPASASLTLNGDGIFVFNVGSSLTANDLSSVVGTANPCNIYWRIGSSATLNGTSFRGTVIADASITIGAGANLAGRALAGRGATGAVTMAGSGGNTIGGCSAPSTVPPVGQVALGKAFFPTTIIAGGVSMLTVVLSNNNPAAATLTSPLTDFLPSGLVIAPTPNASTTCGVGGVGGGVVSAAAGGNTVTLSTASTIPAGTPGTCTVTVNVTAPVAGSFPNSLAACALQVGNGNGGTLCNAATASATLTVSGLSPIATPTLSEWVMVILAALLAGAGFAAIRKRAR